MGDMTEIETDGQTDAPTVPAGAAVSHAAGELKRAAERLLAREDEQAKQAELRARDAVERAKKAELRAMAAEEQVREASKLIQASEEHTPAG
jgi:hypothetical protein